MKALPVALVLCLLACTGTNVWAGSPRSGSVAARHKSGPVTIRGIAQHVTARAFTLVTTSHGRYAVNASPPTHVIEQGYSHGVKVVEGSHVGVRGYVQGRTIRAIEVRVYPVAPKPVSVQGKIAAITGHRLRLRTVSGTVTIVVTGSTVIRTSRTILPPTGLHVGDRIDARILKSGHDLTALHIHVYRALPPARHVQIRGIVTAATAQSMVVNQSGASRAVRLTSATRYYVGSARGTGPARRGEQVTVYACCAGGTLTAGSVHIRAAPASVAGTQVRGTVLSVTSTGLRLDSPRTPSILLQSTTVYEVGAVRTTRGGIRVGDLVSVRGRQLEGVLHATRVHVYASSRRISTIRGPVRAVSPASIQVVQRGAVYTVTIGSGTVTRLAGHSIRISQIHSGDRARAVGHLNGHALVATSLDLTRLAPKVMTIRGIVTSAGASWLVVTRSSGSRQTVLMSSSTRILLKGRPVAGSALFPGVHVVARGAPSGARLQASSVTATATGKSEAGRLTAVSGRTLTLRRTSGAVTRVDLPSGVTVRDGAHEVTLSQLGRGAYLRATGYVELSKALRAVTVAVLHPLLDLSGVLTWHGSIATIRTSSGDGFKCRFDRRSVVSASRLPATLKPNDLPAGTAVHVAGIVDFSGTLAVRTLSARLHSATIRAKIDSMDAPGLSVKTAAGSTHLRVTASTTLMQGSHSLAMADLVVGDDITAYGYILSGNTVLTRKIAVHRRLIGLDGNLTSIAAQSFVLAALDGPHTVLVNPATAVTGTAGTALAPGMKVHVTGYLRGDGAVLATRVRILKVAG